MPNTKRKLSGYAYKFETPREGKMFEDLKEFFLSEQEECLSRIILEYWDIPENSREFDTYEKKTRRIISELQKFFKRTSANTLERFADKDEEVKLWLMAIRPCEDHPARKKYKLITTEDEVRIVGRLSTKRIKRFVRANEKRMNDGVKLFPSLKRQLTQEEITITSLPKKAE